MHISYAGIVLEVGHLRAWDRTPIYDGPTYLYTRFLLRARCYYNPGATSYTLPKGPDAVNPGPVSVPLLATAPVTDVAIRHLLKQPRQQLVVTIGGNEVLRSPRKGFTVDSHNGPKPLQWDVVQVSGTKTYIVDFAIEANVNECYRFNAKAPSVLLSHRWQMHGETDQDAYTTRYITGRAVFNTEKLLAVGGQADDFRDALFHPVPENFRRVAISVFPHEDGSEVTYTLTDRELAINYLIPGVRIEAFKKVEVVRPGAEKFLAAAFAGAGEGAFKGAPGGPGGALAGGLFGGLIRGAIAAIPLSNISCVVRVWGSRFKARKVIEALGINMASAMILQGAPLLARVATSHAEIVHDQMGRFIEVRFSVLAPLIGEGFEFDDKLFLPALTDSFGNDDGIPDITTAQNADNPPPTGLLPKKGERTRYTRGTYVGALVAQALQAPCATSGTPGEPPAAVIRVVPTGTVVRRP